MSVRASIFFAFCLAAAPLLAADGDWVRQGDISIVSKLVRRGVERERAAILPTLRLTDERWKLETQVATPLDAPSRTELGLSGGYAHTFESGARFGFEIAHCRFGAPPAGHPAQTTELTASLALPAGPGRVVASLTREVEREADIGELSYEGEYALKSLGAFLNYRVYFGSVCADGALPAVIPRVADSYTYQGFDLVVPYRIGGQTVVTAGAHYAGTNGARPFWSPSGATPGGRIWLSLAASYEF